MQRRLVLVLAVIVATVVVAACKVTLGDGLLYTCSSDADCAGDSFICTAKTGMGYCCKPSGTERCDGLDNDCDGTVDNTGQAEICNGQDDDCDGKTDEGFDLNTDVQNCGSCGRACTGAEQCLRGACQVRRESSCDNGLDDDNNGKTDCEDSTCEGMSCGTGCTCRTLAKAESACADGIDNDGDTTTDCADSNCVDAACGVGCACVAGGGKKETRCFDGADNDGDTKVDCADPDCVGSYCTAAPLFFTCTAGGNCRCNGGPQGPAETGTLCRDGLDNDCNGKTDCTEASCDNQPCSLDGGVGCVCGSAMRKEADCANLDDDDGDGQVDCADSDCPVGRPCQKSGGASGLCGAAKTCD